MGVHICFICDHFDCWLHEMFLIHKYTLELKLVHIYPCFRMSHSKYTKSLIVDNWKITSKTHHKTIGYPYFHSSFMDCPYYLKFIKGVDLSKHNIKVPICHLSKCINCANNYLRRIMTNQVDMKNKAKHFYTSTAIITHRLIRKNYRTTNS